MINPINSLILAHTKLKSRKIRTIVTVVISSLMFSILALAVILFEGAYNVSFNQMASGSLYSRNMIEARRYLYNKAFSSKVTLEQKATLDQMLDQEIATRKKRAQELGLEFDEKSERQALVPYQSYDGEDTDNLYLNTDNIIAKRFINQDSDNQFKSDLAIAKKIANQTNAKQTFYLSDINIDYSQKIFYQKDNRYDFTGEQTKDGPNPNRGNDTSTINIQNITLAPKTIYQDLLFKNQNWSAKSGKIPILLQLNQLESILNLKPLDDNASLEQRLARVNEIRDKAANLEFKACALNSIANEQAGRALIYQKMPAEDQKQQSLVYAPLDNSKCATPQVIRDTRSAEEKKYTANLAIFNHEFNNQPIEATATELTFQVIGALPNSVNWNSNDFLNSVLTSLVGRVDLNNVVPTEMFFELKDTSVVGNLYNSLKFDQDNMPISEDNSKHSSTIYFEYDTPDQVAQTIKDYNCQPDYMNFDGDNIDNVFKSCTDAKSFTLMTFGSHAADLLSARDIFYQILKIVGIVFAAIATIIMAGTVGRLIGDSRRETAVFRAIGFKRFDISAIYLTYNFLICLLIIATSFTLALIVAMILNGKFAPGLTSRMAWLYGLYDNAQQFSLIGINWLSCGVIAGVIIFVGIISTILPLLRNIRRNPIKDMRDE